MRWCRLWGMCGCSMEVLVLEGGKIAVKCQDECSLCEVCTDVCPNGAITLEE